MAEADSCSAKQQNLSKRKGLKYQNSSSKTSRIASESESKLVMEVSALSLSSLTKKSGEDFLMEVMVATGEIYRLKLMAQCTICHILDLKLFKATTDIVEVVMV